VADNIETLWVVSSCGLYKFCIMQSFIKKYGDIVRTEDVYRLMTHYRLDMYLHNDSGSAILYLEPGKENIKAFF